MSRKSKLSSSEKEGFTKPLLTVCQMGYGPPRVPKGTAGGYLEDALLILASSSEKDTKVAARGAYLAGREKVVVVDVGPLEGDVEVECSAVALGKKLGKPLIRALQKATMGCRGVRLAAVGAMAPLVLKLLAQNDRKLPILRAILVRPELSANVVNGLLRKKISSVPVDVWYDDKGRKRQAMLRHAFPTGTDLSLDDVVVRGLVRFDDDDGGDVVEKTDDDGSEIFFARLEADMSPRTKQYELRCDDVTEEIRNLFSVGVEMDPNDNGEPRAGAMVVRGSRCVLCRGKWRGMQVPSIPVETRESALDPKYGLDALSTCCDVDDDEVIALPISPVFLYRSCGGVTTVHFFRARHPPPDGPLEDADLSDDEDSYDWYLYERARTRCDDPTKYFLDAAAALLRSAAHAGLLSTEYGGVFGPLNLLPTDDDDDDDDEKKEAKQPPEKKLPVTVLSGFLGAGKTTLMSYVLGETSDLRVAVVVNDMAEVNVDAAFLRAAVVESEERMVELTNGCVCCTLREDLLTTLRDLAERGTFDCVLIESSGISEPLPVAETFTFQGDDGITLSSVCDLDTMVTVVDCSTFEKELHAVDRLSDRGWEAHETDDRTVAHLLVDQIEFANVVVLNKCDLIANVDLVERTIRSMNPQARIVRSIHAVVPRDQILMTGSFALHRAEAHPMWLKEARTHEHTPETVEYGISSFVFRHADPLHPRRLRDTMDRWLDNDAVLRAKGIAYLATPRGRDHQSILSLAGRTASLLPGPLWWVSIDRDQWPPGLHDAITPLWHGDDHGDRQNELVVIGRHMDHDLVRNDLFACLVTKEENDDWTTFDDPFLPEWLEIEARSPEDHPPGEGQHDHSHHHHDVEPLV